MSRRAARALHLALFLIGVVLYILFILPRWWVLTGDIPATLATAGRIATAFPIALAGLPVLQILRGSLSTKPPTPEIALRLRAWSAVLHAVAGVLILLAAIAEFWLSLETGARGCSPSTAPPGRSRSWRSSRCICPSSPRSHRQLPSRPSRRRSRRRRSRRPRRRHRRSPAVRGGTRSPPNQPRLTKRRRRPPSSSRRRTSRSSRMRATRRNPRPSSPRLRRNRPPRRSSLRRDSPLRISGPRRLMRPSPRRPGPCATGDRPVSVAVAWAAEPLPRSRVKVTSRQRCE